MLACWYVLLGQFSVTFEYRPGAQHANADGMSKQCGQCRRPDCPVSSSESLVADLDASSVLLDHPFASSEIGNSMDADLFPELSGDLPTAGSDIDLTVASRQDATLTTVQEWVQSGVVLAWSDCAGFPRSYGVGDCRLATYLWIRTGDYGVVGLLRREFSACCAKSGASRDDL